MVKYSDEQLDGIFSALADRTRRKVLASLESGSRPVTELASAHDMSLPGFMKHLRVLENAGLLERTKEGRVVRCTLQPEPMKEAASWIAQYEKFWTDKLDSLHYGSALINIDADATAVGGLGTFGYDDEGVPAQRAALVREGVLSGYLTSRETAPRIGRKSMGSARAWTWSNIPLIRMTNINLLPRPGMSGRRDGAGRLPAGHSTRRSRVVASPKSGPLVRARAKAERASGSVGWPRTGALDNGGGTGCNRAAYYPAGAVIPCRRTGIPCRRGQYPAGPVG